MRFDRAGMLLAIALSALSAISGCTAVPRATPIHTSMPGSSRNSAGFWATLAEQPIVTNDDALHAILLFLDDVDDCATYGDRIESLRARGVLPASFNAPASDACAYCRTPPKTGWPQLGERWREPPAWPLRPPDRRG